MPGHISFDLDGTLIGCEGAIEPLGLIGRAFGVERLRMGTRWLFVKLREAGFNISIYTTSLRSHRNIRTMFHSHGLRVGQVVNGDDHLSKLAGTRASKRPECFGFDLHVDDAPIGNWLMEDSGRVIVVDSADSLWVEHILDRVGVMGSRRLNIDLNTKRIS